MTKKQRKEEARKLLAGPGKESGAKVLAARRKKEKELLEKRETRQVVKELERELAEAGARHDFLDTLIEAPEPEPYKVKKRPGQGRTLPAATYVMPTSDWHMGERVRPETISNRNEYTPEIAQERAEQFWKSHLLMLEGARAMWDVRDAVLWLGGDLMTGYIHEEYLEENFLSPVEEALLVHETLVAGINLFLERSDLDHILVPTNHGNHSRTGEKLKVASEARNSFEWLAYQHLRLHFADEPRLTFQIASGYHNTVDLYGFRINFHHGHKIGFQGGVGGISIPANKRIQRLAASFPLRFEHTDQGPTHLDVFGHWHELEYPRWFIKNGSLIGWNLYAEAKGLSFQDPLQCCFVVDDQYKTVSHFNPIFVTPRKK
jgi:hypothetical protein